MGVLEEGGGLASGSQMTKCGHRGQRETELEHHLRERQTLNT